MDQATPNSPIADVASVLADQPIELIERDGVEYTLLGTAHVSRASVTAVRELIQTRTFDAIAVELCDSRYKALRNPDELYKLDLFQVIREGKAGLVAANLALSSFQRRLAEQFGIEPGAEMKAAIELADGKQLPLWRIDREVGTTLKRAYGSVGFFDRLSIVGGLIASLFSRDEVAEADIEKLKQGDMLESMFDEFAQQSEPLYRSVIGERDIFMAARLREESQGTPVKKVLAIVGAGHLAGLVRELREQSQPPDVLLAPLKTTRPRSKWPKIVGLAILVVIFGAIAIAFSRGAQFGVDALRSWVVFTACGAGLGALIGGGHPLSVLAAIVTGPLKPFRPLLPVGAISAGVETWLRRPQVADFQALRDDLIHVGGWWKNRVARVLLVFMFCNFGMIAGEYLAGIRIVKSLL
jgi:pheromone shutdown-related protein TraB